MGVRGAEFRKCDMQVHSPRDAGWDGQRPEDVIEGEITKLKVDQARYQYCIRFLEHCAANGLQAIAITDHHEGLYCYPAIEAGKQLLKDKKLDIWVFPGMELTCKDSSQALIIFDAGLPQPLFEKARGKLGLQADCEHLKATGIQVKLLDFNVEELQALFDSDDELRNRFLILPHVKPGGHKTVLRLGFHKRFKDMPYVGGYMDCCYPDDLKEGDRRILDGEIPDWTSDKRGVISTSDARSANFQLIGKHATWIKLGSPTAESLRQAMLAPETHIRYAEPKSPSVLIRSLAITGTSYLKDEYFQLNPQMNSFIGGRGAGKSSILEYIRFALGCSALDTNGVSATAAKSTDRMHDMLQSTLSDPAAKVTVELLLNGAQITVSRSMTEVRHVEINNAGKITKALAENVVDMMPIQAFRQGELSDLAREELADRLLAVVTANEAESIREVENGYKETGLKLAESLARSVRLTAASQRLLKYQTEATLIESQIESLQGQLSSQISSSTNAIKDHEKFLSHERNLNEVKIELEFAGEKIKDRIDEAVEAIAKLEKNRVVDDDRLNPYYKFLASLTGDGNEDGLLHDIEALVSNKFADVLSTFKVFEAEWEKIRLEHDTQHSEQKLAMSGREDLLIKLEELNQRFLRTKDEQDKASKDISEFKDADQNLGKLLNTRDELQARHVEIVTKQIATIEAQSSGLARGVLSESWDLREVEEAIRLVLALPQMRSKRLDDLCKAVSSARSPIQQWKNILSELLAIIRWKEGGGSEGDAPPTTPILYAALEDKFIEKLHAEISSDTVAVALRAVIRPKVDLFQITNGIQVDFKKASQGEQAASLLNILMNQNHGPLLIDQPEEDLDNRIINDIIKTIRKTKDHRQLILATHNANITVNGDSELVIEMGAGRKIASGSIDEETVRDAITSTMEGGRQAFELRRRKYNFT